MKTLPLALCLVSCVCAGWAQTNPVVLPRGIVNAFTELPAPSTVGRGGIVQINGLNLGPPGGLKAPAGLALPTQLGDVQVLINGKAAPLYSVDIGQIVAQVPVDAAVGTADLVVQRGAGSSPAAHFTIAAIAPAIRTADGSGFGLPWGTVTGKSLLLSGMGLGPTTPTVDSGAAGAGATPTGAIDAFIGGIRTNASATASSTRVGEFDIAVDVPAGAQAGDLISLFVTNRASNLTTYGTLAAPAPRAMAIPDEAPDFISLADTDLNGNFLIATAARDDSGCFAGWVFDMMKRTAAAIPDCLTTAGRDPMVQAAGSNGLAALVGPPQGTAPAPISSAVDIFSPDPAASMSVPLPSPVTTLAAAAGGNFCAVAPGPPAQTMLIDGQTGAVANQPCGAGAAGGAALGGGGGAIQNLNVDGLTVAFSATVALGQGRSALLVADNANTPTKVEFAVVNQANGRPVLTKAFPDGWQPFLAPAVQAPAGAPGGAALQRPRAVAFLDASGPAFYALASNGDNSRQAFISFPLTAADPTTIAFPDGWYVAACVAAITPFDVQLSSSKILAGSRDGTIGVKQPCNADGFLQLNLDSQTVTAIALPSQGQMAVGTMTVLNDYVYTVNPVVARAATDTVTALDGATGSLVTLRVPTSISGFTVPLQQIPDLNWLVSEATNRVRGDAGLIVFDLDNQVATTLPLPDGFDSVAEQGIYLATRKVVALGQRTGGRGSSFVLYDLKNGNVSVVPNPQGMAFMGPRATAGPGAGGGALPGGALPGGALPGGGLPGGGAGPGGAAGLAAARGLISANTNANTISAIGLDAAGKQVGIVVVRIP